MKNTIKQIGNSVKWRVHCSGLANIIKSLAMTFLIVSVLAIAQVNAAEKNHDYVQAVCTLLGLSNATCGSGNTAGISKFWVTPKTNIDEITFDGQGRVSAITLISGQVFFKYEFEEDTAFFNQTLVINKSNIFVRQTLQWENAKMDTTKRNELMNLIECGLCGLVGIVKDNNGLFWVVGIKYESETDTWDIKPLKPISSDGAQTGANPESDENKFVHILEARNGEYAREFTGAEADIDVTY